MKWKGRRASRNVQDARSRRVTGGGASLGPLINLVGRTFGIKGILAVYYRESGTFRALPGADDPQYVQSNPN